MQRPSYTPWNFKWTFLFREVYSKKAAQKTLYTNQSARAGSFHCHSRSFSRDMGSWTRQMGWREEFCQKWNQQTKLRISFHPDYIQHTCSWENMPKALLEMQDLRTVQGENLLHLSSKFFPPPWQIISQEKPRIFKMSDSLNLRSQKPSSYLIMSSSLQCRTTMMGKINCVKWWSQLK